MQTEKFLIKNHMQRRLVNLRSWTFQSNWCWSCRCTREFNISPRATEENLLMCLHSSSCWRPRRLETCRLPPSTHRIRPLIADEMREHMLQIRIINVLSRNGNLYHGITRITSHRGVEKHFYFLAAKRSSSPSNDFRRAEAFACCAWEIPAE